MKCLSCSCDLEKDQKFCTACGTPVAAAADTFCTNCGARRDPADRFCVSCGSSALPDESPVVATKTTTPVPPAVTKTPVISVNAVEKMPVEEQRLHEAAETKAMSAGVTSGHTPDIDVARPAEVPKKSNGKLLGIAAVIVMATAASGWFLLAGKKPTSAPGSDLPQVARKADSNAVQAQANVTTTVSGRMLVEAAVQGDTKAFDRLLEQLKQVPGPDAGDNKIARKLNEAALMALREKNYAQAVEALEKAIAADPADIEISNNLGYALHLAERYQDAEKRLIQVIEQNPERSVAWANLATTSSKLGKSRQAVAAYVTAYKLHAKPERLLESYKKTAESTDDEAIKKDIFEAVQKIEAQR